MIHRRRGAGLVLAVAGLLGACSTTVSTTTGPINDVQARTAGQQPETADPKRRAQVRMELATGYFQRGQFDVALEEIARVLEIDPGASEAYNLRGLIRASQGDERRAEEDFRQGLRVDPRDAGTMQNYAWFLCQRKRYAEADAMFNQAIAGRNVRDTSRTLLAQGVCQANAGQLAEAERTLARAFEIDPGNPSVAINLADVLYRRGEYDRARFYVRRVNNQPALVNAQTLWLAARIEHRLGNQTGVQELGRQLRARFGDTREAVAFERGQFNE